MRNVPSSLPDTTRYPTCLMVTRPASTHLFQLITFTSLSCAFTDSMHCRVVLRVSQNLMVRSTLHDANTVDSDGLHCRSSTDALCDTNGCASVFQPASVGSVT